MGAVSTPKLDLLRVQETWQFGDEAFNKVIDDMDDKLVGVAHLESKKHWTDWKPETEYEKDDVVRISVNKTHQYYQCLIEGTSGTDEPINNVTGSIVEDGSITWEVVSLSEASVDGTGKGGISVWMSGKYYHRGDAVLYIDLSGSSAYGGMGKGAYGILYRCTVDHFATTMKLDSQAGYWQQVAATIPTWNPSNCYRYGDIVEYHKQAFRYINNIPSTGVFRGWAVNVNYAKDTLICRLNDDGIYTLYICLQTHTSNFENPEEHTGEEYIFDDDAKYWGDYRLDQLPVNSEDKNLWEALFTTKTIKQFEYGETYYPGDMVYYEGSLFYIHTSAVSWNEGATLPEEQPFYQGNFNIISSSIDEWGSNTFYPMDKLATYKNIIYKCIEPHWSVDFYEDREKWILYHNSVVEWKTNDYFEAGQIVKYDNRLYKCNTSHNTNAQKTILYPAPWVTNHLYETENTVVFDGVLYVCREQHISTEFLEDVHKWIMLKDLTNNTLDPEMDATGVSSWIPNISYGNNTKVLYGGLVWICISSHTASDSFLDDVTHWVVEKTITDLFEMNESKWDIIYASVQEWERAVYYKPGTMVVYHRVLYKCHTGHRSINWDADYEYWEIVGGAGGGAVDWTSDTPYNESQLVVVNGILYRAKAEFVSGDTFEEDIDKWEVINADIIDWTTNTYYNSGCYVAYDNRLFKCNTSHTSNASSIENDSSYWDEVCAAISLWKSNVFYKIGSTVIQDNKLYRCIREHTSVSGGINYEEQVFDGFKINTRHITKDVDLGSVKRVTGLQWETTSNNYDRINVVEYFVSEDGTNYTKIGETNNGGVAYATRYFGANIDARYIRFECSCSYGASAGNGGISWFRVYSQLENFVLIGAKEGSLKEWAIGNYNIGDIVLYNNYLYKCMQDHYSESFDISKWQPILPNILDWQVSTNYTVGQYVRYNNKLYRCNTTHTSSSVDFLSDIGKWDSLSSNLAIWVAGDSYNVDDVVIRDNKIYKCIVSNNSSTFVASEWEEISNAANASIGRWQAETHYVAGDYVENNAQLYRCNTTHDSVAWNSELANWDLISGLQIWQANTSYKANSVVFYDGILYKVNISFTSGTVFDATNLEKIGGVGGAVTWQPNTDYSANQLIIHDKLLYRAKIDFTSSDTFNNTNLEQITMGWTAYWQPSTYYAVGETVVQANSIIRCAVAHTSLRVYNTAEAENWVMIASAQAIITYWTPNTEYTSGNAVIHNDILYICNITHISSQDFVNDMVIGHEKWRTINTSATSGSWEQVTKLDVVAPKIVEVIIHNTSTFCLAPVEVLKFIQGTQDVMVNEFTFDAGDGQKFTVDGVRADTNEYVIFDGQVKLKTDYVYPMALDTQTENGYINVSEEIDFSSFKVGEDLVVK